MSTTHFCAHCGERMLTTFRECPNCGGVNFSATSSKATVQKVKIFFSYRPDDESASLRIRDRLLQAFGASNLLIMRTDWDLNNEFSYDIKLQQFLTPTDVFVAVIGPNFSRAAENSGLDGRMWDHIKTAYRCGFRVVLLLIDGAPMLSRDELPARIRTGAPWEGYRISHDGFDEDVSGLIDHLIGNAPGADFRTSAPSPPPPPPSYADSAPPPPRAEVGSAPQPPREAASRHARREAKGRPIDASVFCPRSFEAGESELVQVLVHLRGQRREALRRARASDSTTEFTGASKYLGELKAGDDVSVSLDASGARVEDPPDVQTWMGQTLSFGFRVTSDGQSRHVGICAVLSVNGAYIGRVSFKRRVRRRYAWSDILTAMFPPRLSRFKRVFFSYASVDREEVRRTARQYEQFGISFFQDILSLDPGERWRLRLWKEIDRCDIFLLFWSTAAKQSEWVVKEADRAWRRQARNGGLRPILRPEVLEHPSPIPDQHWLRDFHFNDPKYYKS